MRVAVTAQGMTLESAVDQRFGRCRYFIVFDTDTGTAEVHDNTVNLNAAQGAGIQTAANISQTEAKAVLTGHVGPNAFKALSAAGIGVYTGVNGTVSEALGALADGRLTAADSADAEAHGGF
jgi:predicted Fe-Mo cluster-binding NifX family protein